MANSSHYIPVKKKKKKEIISNFQLICYNLHWGLWVWSCLRNLIIS